MLTAILGTAGSASAANEALQNGRLRFGTGGEASVNASGNLQQPFYYDAVLGGGGWYQLTFSNYPLDNAIGVGGIGTNNWNLNGSVVQNPALSGQVVDTSGFTITSGTNGYGTIVSTGNVTIGGQTFQVSNTYALGQNDSFVKIVTRVTNTGATTLQNLRVWVGTRDDYVGVSDGPTKRRGNLVNGVFGNIASPATQSSALQIEAGTTGVLFYSTSPRAYNSINVCCSFSNAYNQDPATSAITATGDGSYAVYVRMNDLAAGANDEFTWYYAAGELANLGTIAAAVGAASSSGPVSLTVGAPITPFTPVTISGGAPPYTYAISPALPAGLTFNTTTGQITGTPTGIILSNVYTVTITDSASATTSGTFSMGIKDSQTISFGPQSPAAQTYSNGGNFAINPTAAGGASSSPIVYSSTTNGVCTVSGTTVYILAAGTCTVRASQAADASYNAAPDVDQSISIGQASQTLNVPAYGAQTFVASGTFVISASSSSGLAVSFASLTTGVCTVSGTTVTMVAPGTCTVRVSQSGNTNYLSAADADGSIIIGKLNQTIGFPLVPAQTYVPGGTFNVSAASSSGLQVSFTSDTTGVCTVSGFVVTMVSGGTCTIRASQSGSANYYAATDALLNVAISPASQAITGFSPASPVVFGSGAVILSATGGASGSPIVFATTSANTVCTVIGNQVSLAGVGVCNLTANQAASTSYSVAPQVTASITITAASQTIAFVAPSSQPLAGSPQLITGTATSGLAVMFASQTTAVCTTSGVNGSVVTAVALGNCTIRASQAGDSNYVAAVSVDRTFSVGPANSRLMLTSSANIAAYGAMVTLTLNVSGASPTGKVDFIVTYQGTNSAVTMSLCSGVALTAGMASCNVPGEYQKVNPLYFQAAYGGDTRNLGAAASLQQLVSLSRSTLSVTVSPQLPVAGRSLTLNALLTQLGVNGVVSFKENGVALPGCGSIAVSAIGGSSDVGAASCTISAVTAGSHTYVVTVPSLTGPGFEQLLVTVNVAANGPLDYSDLWWGGVAENGWGVSVTQHGSVQFVVLFVYDNAGKPVWYSMPGGTWNGTSNVYSGALYSPTSSPNSAYDVSMYSANAPVGSATITYTSDATATLSYTINGISGGKQIVRQPFSTVDNQPRLQVNDMWWAGSQENGWGLSIDQHGKTLFPVWYTYDAAGKPTFYSVPGGSWNGTTFSGDVYHPTSSAWLGVPYDAKVFSPNKVGTMSLAFVDQDTATMTWTINGVTRTSTIARQQY